MYKTYVRPVPEYILQIRSHHLLSDIDEIENVQRNFTRLLSGVDGKSYLKRLSELNLEFLEARWIFIDLVLFYKIVHGRVEV